MNPHIPSTTVGSELPEHITFQGKRQKKSAMGRSVPKRWAQVDFTDQNHDDHPFIVLTETKFSFRCIPVWIGTLL